MRKGDLESPLLIVLKAILFLMLGLMAAGLLLSSFFSIRNLILLGLAIWAFCRFYYFAFYVIEHYVDDQYHYRGLVDAARHLLKRLREPK